MKLEKIGKGFLVYLHNLDFHIQVESGRHLLARPTEAELDAYKREVEKAYGEPFKVHLQLVDCTKDENGRIYTEYAEHGCLCPKPGNQKQAKGK